MKVAPKFLIAALAVVCLASPGQAAKLFAIDLTYPGGSLQVENSSLPDLVENLIKNSGAFSVLNSEDTFSGHLRYFGLPNTLLISIDRTDPQIIELRITSVLTDFDTTITGTSEDDIKKKLVDWFYLDGGKAAAELLQEVIKASAAAITDGNPGSTTALMADSTFHTFGLFQGSSREQHMRGFEPGAHVGLWISENSYEIDTPAGPMEGTRTRINIPLWLHLGSRVSFVGNTIFDYNNLEGTEFYGLGADVGLAFRPVLRTDEDRFGWQLTPFIGGYAIGSVDGVTAAIVSQFGLVNRFEWRLFDRALLSFVSQYTTLDNLTVKIDEYELATPINQDILKNGIMLDVPLFSLRSLFANGYFIDTRFLEDSKIDNYQTFGAGLSYRLNRFSLNGYLGFDKADAYQGINTGLGFVWDL